MKCNWNWVYYNDNVDSYLDRTTLKPLGSMK